jgi:hypothetical protein
MKIKQMQQQEEPTLAIQNVPKGKYAFGANAYAPKVRPKKAINVLKNAMNVMNWIKNPAHVNPLFQPVSVALTMVFGGKTALVKLIVMKAKESVA